MGMDGQDEPGDRARADGRRSKDSSMPTKPVLSRRLAGLNGSSAPICWTYPYARIIVGSAIKKDIRIGR